MDLAGRTAIYRQIEERRQRPLLVYVTSTRPGLNVSMAADAAREFIDQLDAIPNGDKIDVLIHSSGGDALAAWKLMSLLRERFKSVGVLVPSMAFSAATLFALGADEILMHRYASLGPIDPQITITLADGKQRRFAYEDVGAYLRFVAEDGAISEQQHATPLLDRLLAAVDPIHIGSAKRASELSTDVGARLLATHMEKPEQARQIAEGLNKSFFAHGDAVSRTRAKDLQLRVIDVDSALEDLMWAAYLAIEGYMSLREPFSVLREVLADPTIAPTLAPLAPLQLPSNTPPAAATQTWNAVLNAAAQQARVAAAQHKYDLVYALVESSRRASEVRVQGYLTAFRAADGSVNVARTDTGGGWSRVQMPGAPPAGAGA